MSAEQVCPVCGKPPVDFSKVPADTTATCEEGHKWVLGLAPLSERQAVFVDTSEFVGCRFRFGRPPLSTLADLCATLHVRLLLTDVTRREIDVRIRELADAAATAAKRLGLDGSEFYPAASERVAAFLKSCGAEILPATQVAAGAVFDAYFERTPPFSDRKRSEFPDAFAAAALRTWAIENSELLAVVARDPDWSAVCTADARLTHYTKLAAFVSPILAARDGLVCTVLRLVAEHGDVIDEAAALALETVSVEVVDETGEIADVSIRKVECFDLEASGAEENRVFLDGYASVDWTGTATYEQYNGPDIPPSLVSHEVSQTEHVQVGLSVELSAGEVFDIVDVEFEGTPFGYAVHE